MSNPNGINDHNGQNAKELAKGYKSVDRPTIYPKLYAHFKTASAQKTILSVLDIGCGSGNDAYAIASMGHQVVGIEPSDLHDIAIQDFSHPNIQYRKGQLPALDTVQKGETFDVILLSAVLQYISPQERVESLIKIAQLLNPKGQVFIFYPSPPSRPHQFEITLKDLEADIKAANAQLPQSQQIYLTADRDILPDTRKRKNMNGDDLKFYSLIAKQKY